MPSTVPQCQANGSMSNQTALQLEYGASRSWQALVLGRAGMDLYPEPDGCKIHEAISFSSDLGGSAGNIAVAMAKAGASVSLISALSNDPVGHFVRQRLQAAGVDISLIINTSGNERTSLALAEVRDSNCEVVIYRNNAADLKLQCSDPVKLAVAKASNLVVTGTCLIDPDSRLHAIKIMTHANNSGCQVWLDLDYRAWNWPSIEETRAAYKEATALAQVLIGNSEEFNVLCDDLETQIEQCQQRGQVMICKRGSSGATLYAGKSQLNSGIYALDTLKPYGSGDAFLGNLLVHYMNSGDWLEAVDAGSAAAALVVSQRGCASAMPTPEQIKSLQQRQNMNPAANWS
jgi:5-dehydro-2-deoxygluconokinase